MSDKKRAPFYGTSRWRRVRDRYIAKRPLCERCATEDWTTRGQVVHHRTPIKEGGEPYAFGNLETLCHMHHNREHAT